MVKILTIDDSLFERNAIKSILREAGYTDVLEASNGDEGLRLCGLEKPDIALLDLRLPGMCGLDVMHEVKEISNCTNVIILSIIRNKNTIDDCIHSGASGYISKPITKEKLLPEIKRILESTK